MTQKEEDERITVLIVEDESSLADVYREWLQDSYDMKVAYTGENALEIVRDEGDALDIVLLDRRMPEVSGDEVLSEIRKRGLDCRVAMITAVEPDFDIIKMGFDDYIVKPVSKNHLRRIVQRLLVRSEYDDKLREYFSLASKRAVLEAEKSRIELERSEEYVELKDDIKKLREELTDTLTELTHHEDFEIAFRDILRDEIRGIEEGRRDE